MIEGRYQLASIITQTTPAQEAKLNATQAHHEAAISALPHTSPAYFAGGSILSIWSSPGLMDTFWLS